MSGLQQIITVNTWAASRECAALKEKTDGAKDKQRKAEAEAWRAREISGFGQREVIRAKPR